MFNKTNFKTLSVANTAQELIYIGKLNVITLQPNTIKVSKHSSDFKAMKVSSTQ